MYVSYQEVESHQNSRRQKVTSRLPYPGSTNIRWRRKCSVATATQHPRFVHPFLCMSSPAVRIQTKLKNSTKSTESRLVWGAYCCDVMWLEWHDSRAFPVMFRHSCKNLARHTISRLSSLKTMLLQFRCRKSTKQMQQICRKPGNTVLSAVWPTAPKSRPLSIIIPNRRTDFFKGRTSGYVSNVITVNTTYLSV